MTHQDSAAAMVEEAEELTDALRTQVLFAREYLKSVEIGPKQGAPSNPLNLETSVKNCSAAARVPLLW